MSAIIDIRKSALTLLAAAALSLAGGLASSVHASPLASGARQATQVIVDEGQHGSTQEGRNDHRLTRPANRFQGFVGSADQRPANVQGR
jgi:hypothetical protein